MTLLSHRLPYALALALAASLLACGGKTVGGTSPDPDPTPDPSPSPTPTPTPVTNGPDASACIDVPVPSSNADLSCNTVADCTWVFTGVACAGPDVCFCPSAAGNNAAAARISSELPPWTGECGCGVSGNLACVQGACAVVTTDPVTFDAGAPDSATPPSCINVDASSYDTSCQSDSDCVNLLTGQICDGECDCGGGDPVNVDNQAAWQQATSSVQWGECECPVEAGPTCISGQCASQGGVGSGTGG